MTIRELYKWAKKNQAADLDIEIQYRDSGGYYCGTDDLNESDIDIKDESYGKVIIL